jgi:hypothetical protein
MLVPPIDGRIAGLPAAYPSFKSSHATCLDLLEKAEELAPMVLIRLAINWACWSPAGTSAGSRSSKHVTPDRRVASALTR